MTKRINRTLLNKMRIHYFPFRLIKIVCWNAIIMQERHHDIVPDYGLLSPFWILTWHSTVFGFSAMGPPQCDAWEWGNFVEQPWHVIFICYTGRWPSPLGSSKALQSMQHTRSRPYHWLQANPRTSHYKHLSLMRVPGHRPLKVEKMLHDLDSMIKVPVPPQYHLTTESPHCQAHHVE
jgi:hypothetical protein